MDYLVRSWRVLPVAFFLVALCIAIVVTAQRVAKEAMKNPWRKVTV